MDDGHTADAVEVHHVVAPERAEITEVGDASADAVEVLEVEFDACLGGDGKQVEDGVGRPAQAPLPR